MMLSEEALVDAIFKVALGGCDGDVSAAKNALWLAGTTLLSDVLLNSHPFARVRLLHGLVAELQEGIAHLEQLLTEPIGTLH